MVDDTLSGMLQTSARMMLLVMEAQSLLAAMWLVSAPLPTSSQAPQPTVSPALVMAPLTSSMPRMPTGSGTGTRYALINRFYEPSGCIQASSRPSKLVTDGSLRAGAFRLVL